MFVNGAYHESSINKRPMSSLRGSVQLQVCVNKPTLNLSPLSVRLKCAKILSLHVLQAAIMVVNRSVYTVNNCVLGPKNAAQVRKPREAFSDLGHSCALDGPLSLLLQANNK